MQENGMLALKLFYRRASYRKHLVRKGQSFLGNTLLTRGNAKTLIGRQIVRLLKRSA